MQHLTTVEVVHTERNVLHNLEDAMIIKLGLLAVQVVKQTPLLQVLRDEEVIQALLTHAHVQHDVGVPQIADHLHLLQEVGHLDLVLETAAQFLAPVHLDGHLLTQPTPHVDFAVPTLPDLVEQVQLLVIDEHLLVDAELLQHVHEGGHVVSLDLGVLRQSRLTIIMLSVRRCTWISVYSSRASFGHHRSHYSHCCCCPSSSTTDCQIPNSEHQSSGSSSGDSWQESLPCSTSPPTDPKYQC